VVERAILHHHDDDVIDARSGGVRSRRCADPFGQRSVAAERDRSGSDRRRFEKFSARDATSPCHVCVPRPGTLQARYQVNAPISAGVVHV